ncbi:hypothetical protein, partial [Ralstonia solanacearum]|uniref:hypothetical protein n=1 Tax=Ralstonia solanacearum TaxID=305 RepID=UPI0019D3A04A
FPERKTRKKTKDFLKSFFLRNPRVEKKHPTRGLFAEKNTIFSSNGSKRKQNVFVDRLPPLNVTPKLLYTLRGAGK